MRCGSGDAGFRQPRHQSARAAGADCRAV